MDKKPVFIIIQAFTLLLPLNIYVIGDWLGTGVQWALFRYQTVPSFGTKANPSGASLIAVTTEFRYVLDGMISGRSGISLLIWCIGAGILVAAVFLFSYAQYVEPNARWSRFPPLVSMVAGMLFLSSCILQYGVLLHSQAGFSIPVGVPVVIILGWYLYREEAKKGAALSELVDP